MIKEYQSKTNIYIGIGLILGLLGRVIMAPRFGYVGLGLAMSLAGTVLFIMGCSYYMMAKGHNKWWGLLGLLWLIGLIVLACFPDKCKAGTPQQSVPPQLSDMTPPGPDGRSPLDQLGPKL